MPVLGGTPLNPFSPPLKTLSFKLPPHEGDYLGFCKAKLEFDRLERGPVLPGHFYHPVDLFGSECFCCHPTKITNYFILARTGKVIRSSER